MSVFPLKTAGKGDIIVNTMETAHLVSDSARLLESLGQLPEPMAKPVLIVLSGLPGTGKTYFGRKLAEKLPFVTLESDSLRKTLFAVPTYVPEESSRLFQAIHLLLEKLLNQGISIILDATNLSEKNREQLYNIAERRSVKLILVKLEAPPELVRARLQKRQRDVTSRSDADWEVYKQMRTNADRIRRKHHKVNSSGDITPALNKIAREAMR